MEGLEQLDMVGDISPAMEATEDFIHCMDAIQGQGPSQGQTGNFQTPRQPKQLREVSSAALGKLSSSGVWSLLAGEQPEVGPLGLAWADNFSVLGLGMGPRHGKRSRARSTNDLAAHTKECTNNAANSSSNSAFKKGHNRSRSDVNYRPSAYTDNGLPTVDCNTLKNMILNNQQEADKSSSSSVVKQGEMEQREGPRGRWTPCHVELTPCELRLYTLDSSANLQLGTAYSLSHCQSVIAPAPCSQPGQIPQPADQRTLQALFFNSTRLQLRAATQWEAMEWRQLMWEKVQAARPVRQKNPQCKTGLENQQVPKFPAAMSPSSSPSPSGLDTRPDGDSDTPTSAEVSLSLQTNLGILNRPTTLPLFIHRCQEVLKAGLLHKLMDQNNWRAFTFNLTRSTLQAFPTEGLGSVSQPVLHYSLASCLTVQHDQEPEHGEARTDRGACFQVVFSKEVLHLRADNQLKAQEWVEALRETVGGQRPAQEEGFGEGVPSIQGVLMRSKPFRERRQREAQRAKRQSVTTSFLSILTCLAVEKGLTAQGFRCAGCQRPVGLSRGKAKVCYYSGWYYCQSCHQDNSFLIPARLLHNWDTNKHKVSKQAKEFLEFVYEEPLLDIQQLNPCLYEHCEPLSTVLRLRQQLQSLRAYLFNCRATVAEDLRRRIFPREYLLQHIHLYSMADLQQVIDGKLAPFLSKVIKFASSHVFSCSLCREKGFICELCHNGQVIYPFQENATKRCDGCGAVFHAECRQKAQPCPRCVRRELHHKRPSSFWSPDDDSPGCFHLPYQDT
ncbi:pleckstrin homology domain-containing family M member 3 [Mastacembelus armatus]|uniref:Pleckstrin homology domain containing, family M, member 3 n=1 Tax=Mastacembelus armatus TaxID=205130 RepID=A0A3Q3MZU2_9TELE|nr:pleckstrin homology domain-containing family M member 3 [Mastacembelus armatus]XP_026151105.1 pleckstrin homology domain-containing family M member 3 [Mastacembelus armatus]XP_026151106.1 pleckstrin homology domain-containing family M member 3 [Mastacembelus armatus]